MSLYLWYRKSIMAHIYILPTFDEVLWRGVSLCFISLLHLVLRCCCSCTYNVARVFRNIFGWIFSLDYWWGGGRRNPWIHSHGDILRPNRYSSCSSLHTELKVYILWCSHDVGYSGAVRLYEPSELYYVVDILVKLNKSMNYHYSLALLIREVTFYSYKIELKSCSDSAVYRRYAVLQNQQQIVFMPHTPIKSIPKNWFFSRFYSNF